MNSDLSGGLRYRPFEQPWRGLNNFVQLNLGKTSKNSLLLYADVNFFRLRAFYFDRSKQHERLFFSTKGLQTISVFFI